MGYTLVVVLLLTALSAADDSVHFPLHPRRLVCHMSIGKRNFTVADAEAALPMCTHIVYNYFYINSSTFQVYSVNPTRDFGEEGLSRLVAFKKRFPYLKMMVGVGGPHDNGTFYSLMARNPESRATFIASVMKILLENNLDGMDLDWRDPVKIDRNFFVAKRLPDHSLDDKFTFVELAKELRQQFDEHYLLLSLTLTGNVGDAFGVIDPQALGEAAHFLNIRTFDFIIDDYVRHISPYYSNDNYNSGYSLNFYTSSGIYAEDINRGISSEHVIFTINNETDVDSWINAGKVLKLKSESARYISENEFCMLKEKGGWLEIYDENVEMPMSWKGNQIVSHENLRSLHNKADSIRLYNGLMGIAYYGLEEDDFRGDCVASKGKYPLLRRIDESLVHTMDNSDDWFAFRDYNARYFWNLFDSKKWDEDKKNFNWD